MKSAVPSGSVSEPAELSGILDLPLNKDFLFKDAFAMEPWLSLSKDINGRCICQNSESRKLTPVNTNLLSNTSGWG